MKLVRRLMLFSVVSVLCIDHATGQFKMKKKEPAVPAEPTVVTLKVQVPSLALLSESEASQVRGGLRITLQPDTFGAEDVIVDTARQVTPPNFLGLTIQPDKNAVYIRHTSTARMTVKPEKLVLHVHINNQLPRVFRGSGIAVQFNIAGKVTNVAPSGYGELVNVIIPPRSEQDLTIIGPEVANIPSPCTIGVFFYDVVTKMDPAGNITEKQNYEWYYSYRTQATEKDVNVPAPTAGWEMPH